MGFAINGGIWSLQNNSNAFSGGITLESGTLQVTAGGAAGTGTLTILGGVFQNSGGAVTLTNNNPDIWNRDFGMNGGGSGLSTGTGSVILGANRTVRVTNTVTVGGSIVDSGSGFSLTQSGPGTFDPDG